MVSFRNTCTKLNFLIIRLTVCFPSVVTLVEIVVIIFHIVTQFT